VFSDGNVNGVIAPAGAVSVDNLRDTLTGNGWRIDFLGPTTYLGNISGFSGDVDSFAARLPPERVEQMRQTAARFDAIRQFLDDDRVHLPFTAVHATRVDAP